MDRHEEVPTGITSTLEVDQSVFGQFTVNVGDNSSIVLDMGRVFDVKQQINSKTGVPVREQHVWHAGKELLDDSVHVMSYGIRDGSHVQLLVPGPGGVHPDCLEDAEKKPCALLISQIDTLTGEPAIYCADCSWKKSKHFQDAHPVPGENKQRALAVLDQLSNLNFALTKSEKLIIRTQYANTGKFENMDDARQFMKFVRSRLGSATRAIINTDSKYTLANEPIRHVSEFSQVFPGQNTFTRENLMFKTFTTRDACDKEYRSMLQVHHPVPCSYFCRPLECVDFSHNGHTAHLLVMPSFGHHVLIKPQDFELVVASLCAMLLTFHLKELCYGDLKPQHVFVTQAGVRVIDGGSICAIGEELKSSTNKYSLDATKSGIGSVALDFVCLATTMYEILYGNAFAGADVEIEARTINGMCLALERKRFSNPYGLVVDLKEQELDNTRIDMMIAALDGPITLSSYLNPSSVAGVDPQIDAVRSSITLTLEDLVGEATDSELPLTLIQLIVSFLY